MEAQPENDVNGPQGQGASSTGAGDQGDSLDSGGAASSAAPHQPPVSREREPPNPFKQEGNINEEWHRRLNMVQQPTDEVDEKPEAGQSDKEQPKDRKEKGCKKNNKGCQKNNKNSEEGCQKNSQKEGCQKSYEKKGCDQKSCQESS